MLSEILSFVRHAPGALVLKAKLPQDDFYAEIIDRADKAGLAERRRELVSDLRGRVVEIGAGTGSMFRYYEGAEVTAVEPDPAFAAHARDAARGKKIDVVDGTGEKLPLPDASMDAAVLALVLCSVHDVDAVCREVARVVKPGGAVRLIEHVISEKRLSRTLMHAIDPLWLRLNGQGCHLDRDPLPALDRAGIRIESIDAFQIWSGAIPAFPMRLIRAVRSSPTS